MVTIHLPDEPIEADEPLDVIKSSLLEVNLKYWHSGSECISEWGKPDLKGFRKTIDKVQGYTLAQMQADGGLEYKPHKSKPAAGFARPASLSKDLTLYEIRTSQKSRLHGFVENSIFYIVWFDKNHAVFPQKK